MRLEMKGEITRWYQWFFVPLWPLLSLVYIVIFVTCAVINGVVDSRREIAKRWYWFKKGVWP